MDPEERLAVSQQSSERLKQVFKIQILIFKGSLLHFFFLLRCTVLIMSPEYVSGPKRALSVHQHKKSQPLKPVRKSAVMKTTLTRGE